VVSTHYPRDLRIVLNVREDMFADHDMLLHLKPFLESERARLLEESIR